MRAGFADPPIAFVLAMTHNLRSSRVFSATITIRMSTITIEVWDATGNKKQLVELPADAPVNRVIAVLVDRMNLPRHSPDGQLMSYKFHHKASGRQLLDEQSLEAADVQNGDVLRLQPEITAGRRRLKRRGAS
jgi:uncharacterized ubiquitin-like protein YukD